MAVTSIARRGDAAALTRATHLAKPVVMAGERTLAVLPALAPLFPDGGLRRGNVLTVGGTGGATSLALALTVAAAEEGSWVAGMGLASLGLAAAAGLGVPLERLVLVRDPGSTGRNEVLATLLDSFDIVLVGAGGRGAERTTGAHRRLQAKGRERGSVLVAVGGAGGFEPDLRLRAETAGWDGLEPGAGHLQGRRVVVEAGGRRAAMRPRRTVLWLPAADGTVQSAVAPASAVSIPPPEGLWVTYPSPTRIRDPQTDSSEGAVAALAG